MALGGGQPVAPDGPLLPSLCPTTNTIAVPIHLIPFPNYPNDLHLHWVLYERPDITVPHSNNLYFIFINNNIIID
jgi:hypothetical protein